MSSTKTNLLSLLLLLLLSTTASTSNPPSTDFIRRSCGETLYPRLCSASLAPHARAIHQSPLNLAATAANLSLAKIHNVSSLAAAIQLSCAGRQRAAVRDCVELLRAAADLTNQSTAEMGKVGGASEAGGTAWGASNAQTWMSAALTNEDTCVDGFEGVEMGKGVKVMCDRVGEAKKYTSIALALLNALVHGVRN